MKTFDPNYPERGWYDAEPIPFHYGLLARAARWLTGGRWPK